MDFCQAAGEFVALMVSVYSWKKSDGFCYGS